MLLVSFCHGYQDKTLQLSGESIPSLLLIDEQAFTINQHLSLDYPRNQEDFGQLLIPLKGSLPLSNTELDQSRLPRFGVMGLCSSNDDIFAATWNGIYRIRRETLSVQEFISHQLLNDPHGIAYSDGKIYSVATTLDTLVITDASTGQIIDHITIDRDLSLHRNRELLGYDWRFISKQARGAVGFWHFNHVVVQGSKVLLTSRLCSCFVEIDLIANKATIRSICWDTPVMLHDGIPDEKGGFVFTSVDGKLLPAGPASSHKSSLTSLEMGAFSTHMRRDMVNTSIRLSQILGREINWCRGIAFDNDYYYTTLEGRYDQQRPYFKVAKILRSSPHSTEEIEVSYDLLPFASQLRYMTGFSILIY